MAWSTPSTKSSGEALSSTEWNEIVNDTVFLGGARAATVATSQTTTSTSFTALATAGPSVSVLTGTSALVILGAYMSHNTSAGVGYMSFAVTGASSVAASTSRSLLYQAFAINAQQQASASILVTGLTAGSNTFTALYAVSAGTGTWANRTIAVIPLTA